MKHIIIIGFSTILITGCAKLVTTNLVKTYPPLDFKQEIFVCELSDEEPVGAIEIGTVKVLGTASGGYHELEVSIAKAKLEARKAGGNVLKITEYILPGTLGSSCDGIAARILKVDNPDALSKLKESENGAGDKSWNYAKLFVYRPGGAGVLIGYNLYLGDSVICRVKDNSKYEIKITKDGMNKLWAKTEDQAEIPINIEYGKEYYVRCTVETGTVMGHPLLQLVDKKHGKYEYISVRDK